MASAALILHEDGSIEATPELKETLQRLHGARLELVQQSGAELRFRIPTQMREIKSWRDLDGILARPPHETAVPPDLATNPMSLRGILRNAAFDPNAYLAADRAWELAREEWLYGPYSDSQSARDR